MSSNKTVALIVAAGEGSRAGGEMPKQYRMLKGKPLLLHAIEAFSAYPAIDEVWVVIKPGHEDLFSLSLGENIPLPLREGLGEGSGRLASLERHLPDPPPNPPPQGGRAFSYVTGGETRQESVRLGLNALEALAPERVLIHDAARPFVSAMVIGRVLEGLAMHKAVIPVMPVTDTLKTVRKGKIKTVDRSHLHRAQTPQGFDFALIRSLHEKYAGREATDDAMLAEWDGIEVGFVPGDERNMKITTSFDLSLAEHV